MKILLVNPANPTNAFRGIYSAGIYSALCGFQGNKKMHFGLPLALPTLAAVTPPQHTVTIVDEMVQTIDFDGEWDLVGITSMTFKAPRAYEIAAEFKQRGIIVIMGGIHASVRPKEVSQHVDSVVVGEADDIWPKILEDVENKQLQPIYNVKTAPDISKAPPPRHDLASKNTYFFSFLQTTRGCPFSCNFCTVTQFNGRIIRKKSPEQVVQEMERIINNRLIFPVIDTDDGKKKKMALPIFFVDDNFAIDRKHAIAVCRALIKFQNEKGIYLDWFTQVNYAVGLDDELLSFLSKAGCRHLYMGFESLSPASLKAMKKTMNSPEKYAAAIQNAKRYGFKVVFSTILGSEFDDIDCGNILADFIEEEKVFYVSPNIMTPLPGTKSGDELEQDGRIVVKDFGQYNSRNAVFQPRLMTPFQLQSVYVSFCLRLFTFDKMIKRATELIKQPQRYKFPILIRLIIWILFTKSAVQLTLRKKIKLRVFLKLLLISPRFILLNGSLSSMSLLPPVWTMMILLKVKKIDSLYRLQPCSLKIKM